MDWLSSGGLEGEASEESFAISGGTFCRAFRWGVCEAKRPKKILRFSGAFYVDFWISLFLAFCRLRNVHPLAWLQSIKATETSGKTVPIKIKSMTRNRNRWEKFMTTVFLHFFTVTGNIFLVHRNRHRHRKNIFVSPSPSPSPWEQKVFTVTVTEKNKIFHRHRNRGAVTVTTVFSPSVTCHR